MILADDIVQRLWPQSFGQRFLIGRRRGTKGGGAAGPSDGSGVNKSGMIGTLYRRQKDGLAQFFIGVLSS